MTEQDKILLHLEFEGKSERDIIETLASYVTLDMWLQHPVTTSTLMTYHITTSTLMTYHITTESYWTFQIYYSKPVIYEVKYYSPSNQVYVFDGSTSSYLNLSEQLRTKLTISFKFLISEGYISVK